MISLPWMLAGGLSALVLTGLFSFNAGNRYCQNKHAVETAKATIAVVKSRQGAEAAVNKLDERGLCLELGGGEECGK